MKFNKWTLGLAAVGAVSLASAARAEEAQLSQVQTALSNTTISGYVSSSVNWQWAPSASNVGSSPASNIPLQSGKANGFNLDVVKLSLAKPMDETEWASGYQVDLLFGPDAVGWNPSVNAASDSSTSYAIQQAYIALRTPVGNGIDWKVGVFNTVVGYESFDAGSNPNYTRSWGWAVEPTEHTGILGAYKISDELSLTAGVANTLSTGINTRSNYNPDDNGSVWQKTVMGSVTYTAPSDWGWAAGSAFYAGVVYGFAGSNPSNQEGTGGFQNGNQANVYAGATLNSPWENVTFGAAFDYVQNLNGTESYPSGTHADDYIFAVYNTIKPTEKLSFNSRAEYWEIDFKSDGADASDGGISLTETVQYDLWANVVSRLEFRYDHVMSDIGGTYVLPNAATVSERTSYGLYANIIYKF
jgi:hypothetical protein